MEHEFPLRPEHLPPDHMDALAHDTRAMTEFFQYFYPILADREQVLHREPVSRAQDRMNDWGDPIAWRKPDWPEF